MNCTTNFISIILGSLFFGLFFKSLLVGLGLFFCLFAFINND